MKYPIGIQWIFPENFFDSFDADLSKSQRFRLPGLPVTYYLTMKFNQIDDDDPDISVFFHCYSDYDEIEIEADFRIAVKLVCQKTLKKIKVRGTKCCFNNAIDEIECYSVVAWEWWNKSGEIIFEIVGNFVIKKLHSIPLSLIVPKINQLFADNDDQKDFTIIAEGQELKIHKSIFQNTSPVFCRMLESNWKESNESKIELKFLSFKLAKIFIDLIYGQRYWGILDIKEYIQLYQFADQYNIPALKNAVKNSLILTPKNIVEYTNLVAETKIDELIRHCIDYLILCSQYSLSIKNIDSINDFIKIQISDRIFSSPFLKRNVEDENICRVSKHSIEKKMTDPFEAQSCALPEIQMPSVFSPLNVPIDYSPFFEYLQNHLQQQKPLEEFQQQFWLWQQQQWQILMNTFALAQQEQQKK